MPETNTGTTASCYSSSSVVHCHRRYGKNFGYRERSLPRIMLRQNVESCSECLRFSDAKKISEGVE